MNLYSDAPILDVARLDMLEKNVGPALHRICERFLSDCANALENLAVTIQAKNHEETRKLAHQMKGASVSLGLPRLEFCFRYLEETARAGSEIPEYWHGATVRCLEDVTKALEARANPTDSHS